MIIIASQIAQIQISQYRFLNYHIFHNYTSSTKNYGGLATKEVHGLLVHWQGLWHGMAVRWGVMRWCVRVGQLGDVRGECWMLLRPGWLWLLLQPSVVSSSVLWRVA